MTSAEDFADKMIEREYVHDARAYGGVFVLVVRDRSRQECDTASFDGLETWRVAFYHRNEHGDHIGFIHMEDTDD